MRAEAGGLLSVARPQMSNPALTDVASIGSRTKFERAIPAPADPFAGKALISTREAVFAGLGSRSKVQALIRENMIQTIKVGRSRLIVVESIRAMIAAGGV